MAKRVIAYQFLVGEDLLISVASLEKIMDEGKLVSVIGDEVSSKWVVGND